MKLRNVYRLGIKELLSLGREPFLLILIALSFSASIYSAARALPETLHKAAIAIVDEDRSALSARLIDSFYPPQFIAPVLIDQQQIDPLMDAGRYTFALVIPPSFQRDVLAGRQPAIQLNVDATRMSQAFTGSGYIQQIVVGEVNEFVARHRDVAAPPVELVLRMEFNQNLDPAWFGSVMELINSITMISIVLAGAALIREREHGTIEHLLVMPVTPAEIMLAKVWSMGLVVLVASGLSLQLVIRDLLAVPITGSVALFLVATLLHLFATTSLGIFMATVARSMPQFGLLLMLTLLPLQMLSGGSTPRESMPAVVQHLMLAAPTTHFVAASQAILYRGAGLDVVWSHLVGLALIGTALFAFALQRFRATITKLA